MKNVNKEILQTLTKVAAANPHPAEKFAAAIVFRNRIVSVGLNSMKSHPMAAKYSKNKHAIFLHSEDDPFRCMTKTGVNEEIAFTLV